MTTTPFIAKFIFYVGVVDERGRGASWAQRQSEGLGTEGPTHHAKKTNRPFAGLGTGPTRHAKKTNRPFAGLGTGPTHHAKKTNRPFVHATVCEVMTQF